ncbi:MAG: acyltransferase [Anaerolineales bacterium]|nr:acyltransferase [Anaerolineales bacterium]
MSVYVHLTAEIEANVVIGTGTSVWHHCQIRRGASIGENSILGKGVFVDFDVHIGSNVKIQNYVSIYHGVTIEDGVFIGPHVCFTNDLRPRAINPDGRLKGGVDWVMTATIVRYGAALGASSTIRCGVEIGRWAMVGAGSVVTRDVPAHGLVYGNPAYLYGFVCPCGGNLEVVNVEEKDVLYGCGECHREITIPLHDHLLVKNGAVPKEQSDDTDF